jgi:hypothetical protein
MNPRYVAYCLQEHGSADFDAVLAADRKRFPGGCMCGFSLFIQAKWSAFSNETGRDRYVHTQADHDAFDAWLALQGAREAA